MVIPISCLSFFLQSNKITWPSWLSCLRIARLQNKIRYVMYVLSSHDKTDPRNHSRASHKISKIWSLIDIVKNEKKYGASQKSWQGYLPIISILLGLNFCFCDRICKLFYQVTRGRGHLLEPAFIDDVQQLKTMRYD